MHWRLVGAVALVATAVSVVTPMAEAEEPTGGTFTPITSTRLLDTRNGTGRGTPFGANEEWSMQVAGIGGVPGAGAAAVAVDVSAHSPTGAGFLKLWASGAPVPSTSNLNFATGQTASNYAIVPIGSDGKINILSAVADSGTTHVVVDVHGWVSALTDTQAAGRYQPVTAQRLVDTRTLNNIRSTPVLSQEAWTFKLTNVAGVPATNVSAVAINLTVPAPQLSGWNSVYTAHTPRPATSSMDYVQGVTIASFVMAPVNADGFVTVYNSGPGVMNAIIDIQGYLTTGGDTQRGGMIEMLSPTRIVDTRTGLGGRSTPLGTAQSMSVTIRGVANVPLDANISGSALVQVTAVSPTADGYVTVWPSGVTRPAVSHQNFTVSGPSRGAFVITKIGTDGKIQVFNSSGSTGILVDVLGYVTPRAPNRAPSAPADFAPAAQSRVAEAQPQLSATVSDPDLDRLATAWSIRDTSSQQLVVSSAAGPDVPSGGTGVFRVPLGKLRNGVTYEWQVSACDGTACTNSPWLSFVTDGTNPLPVRPEESSDIDPADCFTDNAELEPGLSGCAGEATEETGRLATTAPRHYWAYSGQDFSDAPTNSISVLADSVRTSSTGNWSAAGLVRNELFQVGAVGVVVSARLLSATGDELAAVSSTTPAYNIRPGEPVPFTIGSAVDAALVASVEWSAAPASVGSAQERLVTIDVLQEFVYAPDRDRDLIDHGYYIEDPNATSPLPYVVWGSVMNEGAATISNPRALGAWLDDSGRVLKTVDVPVTNEQGVPVPLAPGELGVYLIVVDDSALAPSLIDAHLVVWEVSS